MGKTTLTNVTMVYGEFDLSGDTNNLDTPFTAEMKDCTTFASGVFREYTPGLFDATWSFRGFNELALDEFAFERLAATYAPAFVTLSNPPVVEDVAYVLRGITNSYKPGLQVGELWSYELSLMNAGLGLRGVVCDHRTATATGNGASATLPAVSSGQTLYAYLFVTSASAASDTLDLVVESDADNTYASAVTRITFDQMTDVGWQLKTVAGPITDVEYRAARTIGGTSPSFKYTVVLAVL